MQSCDPTAYRRLRTLAIALPVCLGALFLAIGLVLHINRRRIVIHLYHKYNEQACDASPYEYSLEAKCSSKSTFPPGSNTHPECVSPDINTSPSTKPDPYCSSLQQDSSRTLGTPNFGALRQSFKGQQHSAEQLHYSERPHAVYRGRCPTPDTPLSRKDQLAHRSQLIQETHVRLGSISPEPPLMEPPPPAVSSLLQGCTFSAIMSGEPEESMTEKAVKAKERPVSFSRPLSKTSRPTSPHVRPTSPTGSIRLIDRNSKDIESLRRIATDKIESSLDEVFVPEWHPEGGRRVTTT